MSATLIPGHVTVYEVTSHRLTCSRFECEWTTKSPKHEIGKTCPKCAGGVLERTGPYRVDLMANHLAGQCDCPNWRCDIKPKMDKMSEDEIKLNPPRCKHCWEARRAACEPENFDALLKALPNQETQT